MQPYLAGNGHNFSQIDYQLQSSLVSAIKRRFRTYGYLETGTSTFQDYDMYSSMIGNVRKHNMIKTIDPSGDVLVLRPDMTIPISWRMSYEIACHSRLFILR